MRGYLDSGIGVNATIGSGRKRKAALADGFTGLAIAITYPAEMYSSQQTELLQSSQRHRLKIGSE